MAPILGIVVLVLGRYPVFEYWDPEGEGFRATDAAHQPQLRTPTIFIPKSLVSYPGLAPT